MFERLTIRTDICIEPENDIVYHNPNDPEGMYNILDLAECLYSGGEAEAGILMEISRRLAAYEDSQMTPEEVQSLAQAKAEGRLVVLPCKVGDAVYEPFAGKVYEKTVDRIIINRFTTPQIWIETKLPFGTPRLERWDLAIGKTVFLTPEEAYLDCCREIERGAE